MGLHYFHRVTSRKQDELKMFRLGSTRRGIQMGCAVALFGALHCAVYDESMLASGDAGARATGRGTTGATGGSNSTGGSAGTAGSGGGSGGAGTGASSGGTGIDGSAGENGSAGGAGTVGSTGSGGTSGSGATGGAAGTGASSGSDGTTGGVSGASGEGGTGGATGGAAGSGGNAGTGGATGDASGMGGTGTTGGAAGATGGTGGAAGTGGTGGAAGNSGTAGTGDAAGTGGIGGAAGTGGTGGGAGIGGGKGGAGGAVDAGPDGGPGPTGGGDTLIIADHSDKCMTVEDNGTTEGTNIEQQTCTGSSGQVYRFQNQGGGVYKILHVASGRYVSANGPATKNYVVELRNSSSSTLQHFNVVHAIGVYYNLVNLAAGCCIDIYLQQTSNGAPYETYDCNGASNQTFRWESP
jgi:hypothetical protein